MVLAAVVCVWLPCFAAMPLGAVNRLRGSQKLAPAHDDRHCVLHGGDYLVVSVVMGDGDGAGGCVKGVSTGGGDGTDGCVKGVS